MFYVDINQHRQLQLAVSIFVSVLPSSSSFLFQRASKWTKFVCRPTAFFGLDFVRLTSCAAREAALSCTENRVRSTAGVSVNQSINHSAVCSVSDRRCGCNSNPAPDLSVFKACMQRHTHTKTLGFGSPPLTFLQAQRFKLARSCRRSQLYVEHRG